MLIFVCAGWWWNSKFLCSVCLCRMMKEFKISLFCMSAGWRRNAKFLCSVCLQDDERIQNFFVLYVWRMMKECKISLYSLSVQEDEGAHVPGHWAWGGEGTLPVWGYHWPHLRQKSHQGQVQVRGKKVVRVSGKKVINLSGLVARKLSTYQG